MLLREEESNGLLCLTAKAIKSAALPFQSIDHIHGSDSLPLGMLRVGDSITDDILKEDLEDTTGLLIDEARDTLDSSTTSQTPDCWLCDALDVVSQHLAMTLGASLSKSLSSFATSGHVAGLSVNDAFALVWCRIYRVCWPIASQHQACGWSLAWGADETRHRVHRMCGVIEKLQIFYKHIRYYTRCYMINL